MGNCRFIRQKKQVKINGEWVDTRSYRYLPYCEVLKKGITFKRPPRAEAKIFFKGDEKGQSIYLDGTDKHIEIENGKILEGISINGINPSCEVEVNGCDVNYVRMTGMGKVDFSCSRLVTNSLPDANDCYVDSITFKECYTSEATSMGDMFYRYLTLKSIDVSGFDTSNVTNMCGMFDNCQSLTSLDLSNFDTSNVPDMSQVFEGCSNSLKIKMIGCKQSTIDKIKAQLKADGITGATITTK